MGKCSYTWKELGSQKGEMIEKKCPEETWKGSDRFCIFHDPSPEKDADLFKEKLKEQVQSETDKYCFVGYFFPEGGCNFKNQEFSIDANFWGATFQGYAVFEGATFQDSADFWGATFQGYASFGWATFQDTADFRDATFQGTASFEKATFQDTADFRDATFHGTAHFWGATFQDAADFWLATFQGYADFWGATFQGYASFGWATFQGTTDFIGATFQDTAGFEKATFQDTAGFEKATFQKMEFDSRDIQKLDLRYSEFLSRSYITANLEKTLFHRAFLENVSFIDCTWPDKMTLYEEKNMNDIVIDLSYNQLETIYRDLKQNMQQHGDYKTAGDFYFREMECRKESMREKRFSSDWFKSFGYSLLKYTCGYGEKPERTVLSSFFTIFAFAILYWTTDCLQHTIRKSIENPTIYQGLKDAIYFSFVTFTTLGLGDISPFNDLGKFLICCEAIIGAFLIALFVVVFARKMMR